MREIWETIKEMADTPLKKWGVIIVVVILTALGLYSCGSLQMKGTNEYEYYRKGKGGEEVCSRQESNTSTKTQEK